MSIFITLLCPDYKTGFGGNFGVQSDRVDKSAVGWEHHEQVDKHESQKGEQIKRQKSERTDLPGHKFIFICSRLQNWIRGSIWRAGGQGGQVRGGVGPQREGASETC